jgi:hypothetical protein
MTAKNPISRSQLIEATVTEAVLKSRMQWNVYAGRVVEHYHDNVAVPDRSVRFHVASCGDDAAECQRLNTQTVRRLLSGEVRMTVDVEESLIAALPEEWAVVLMTRLLERSGLLFARKPAEQGDVVGQINGPCELMRSCAETIQSIAPMLEDNNRIGPEDFKHFPRALHEINETQGVLVTLTRQITQAMGGNAKAVQP